MLNRCFVNVYQPFSSVCLSDAMSARVSVSSKERVLSPKRKKDFKGQLIVLDEGVPGDTTANETNARFVNTPF